MSGQGPQQPHGVGRPQGYQPTGTAPPPPPPPSDPHPAFRSACWWHFPDWRLLCSTISRRSHGQCTRRAANRAALGMSRLQQPALIARRFQAPGRTAAEPIRCGLWSAGTRTAAARTPGRTGYGQRLQHAARCSSPTVYRERRPVFCRWLQHGQHLASWCTVTCSDVCDSLASLGSITVILARAIYCSSPWSPAPPVLAQGLRSNRRALVLCRALRAHLPSSAVVSLARQCPARPSQACRPWSAYIL